MDINLGAWYKGECRAPGLYSSRETEIVESSESLPAGEEPDLDLAYDELEAIKRRLKVLRGKLLYTPPDPCELEVPSPLEDASFLTKNQQIMLQLRRNNCVLRCQLQKMVKHLYTSRKQMKWLESLRCQLRQRLDKMANELESFRHTKEMTIHQFSVCIERNEQIKAIKVDEKDFALKILSVVGKTESRMRHLVPVHCHLQLHYDLSVELFLIRIFLHTMFRNMIEDWYNWKQRIHCKIPGRMGVGIILLRWPSPTLQNSGMIKDFD